MHAGSGRIVETYLDGSARIECPPGLVPAPGQYLQAHAPDSDSPLPASVFLFGTLPNGFRAAPPLSPSWRVGTRLNLRGPIGHGFDLPASARKIAFVAMEGSPARLRSLISTSLEKNLEIVLACDSTVQGLPEAVEVQPLQALNEICRWADAVAVDVSRETLDRLKGLFEGSMQVAAVQEAQVLVHASMPCGGLAECGVCAVPIQRSWRMACKDGPVFPLKDLFKSPPPSL
jgi:dihydroorotate dehydrogenase electron transfer subunit